MKRFVSAVLALLVVAVLTISVSGPPTGAQGRSGDQQMARIRFVKDGVQAQGAGVQQMATVGTLSAAVASATRTEVVAAPAAGLSTVLLGVWLEKATATTGTTTISYGTGTNCGTGTTTIVVLGPQTSTSLLPVGYYPVGAIVPAAKAVCIVTDAATTSARVLSQ